jgi:hypothetical protein
MAGWHLVEAGPSQARLNLELTSLPLVVERLVEVVGSTVTVRDKVENRSHMAVDVMWTQHPGLGGDLLKGTETIQSTARTVALDNKAGAVGIDARPGQAGQWPVLGDVDLRHPTDGSAILAYLHDFDGPPQVSVMRDDGLVGVGLTWDAAIYPHCWLWEELGGTGGPPWHGKARVIGIEPATSWPGQGLATVSDTTRTALRIAGGQSVTGAVALTVGTRIRQETQQ